MQPRILEVYKTSYVLPLMLFNKLGFILVPFFHIDCWVEMLLGGATYILTIIRSLIISIKEKKSNNSRSNTMPRFYRITLFRLNRTSRLAWTAVLTRMVFPNILIELSSNLILNFAFNLEQKISRLALTAPSISSRENNGIKIPDRNHYEVYI